MDKKLLALFRKLFALDDKALPDSISPEDFGKLIEKSDGKLFIKPEDFKNLQKTVGLKDVELKKALGEIEKVNKKNDDKKSDSQKALDKMSETISTLEKTIGTMNSAQETERLTKEYPDILPELLAGKTKDEIEAVVDRQRAINKKLYGDSNKFAPPDYSNEADIDEAIESVKGDKTKNGVNSAVDILKLSRQKDGLPNED